MSAIIKPMLCKEPADKHAPLPDAGGWIIEPKLDGWRFLFRQTEDGVQSFAGRNGSDRTGQLPMIERALDFLPVDTILDAEVVAGTTSSDVAYALAHGGPLLAVVFDVLVVGGTDVCHLPWTTRRELLEATAEGFDYDHVMLSVVEPSEEHIHHDWLEGGFEGSVAKRRDSEYRPGARSSDWLKYKPQESAEAEVTGYKPGKGSRTGTVGAFEITMLEDGVETSCGCPPWLAAQIDAGESWIGRVIEVRHHGLTVTGKPRHPVFARRREDREVAA